MLYGVHITADTYYEVEADNEDEAVDMALEFFEEYVPDYEVEKMNEEE